MSKKMCFQICKHQFTRVRAMCEHQQKPTVAAKTRQFASMPLGLILFLRPSGAAP
jgi:hypothetical protein